MMMSRTEAKVGVVIPRTGRLAELGLPLAFAGSLLEPELAGPGRGGGRRPVRLLWRDSRSDPAHARVVTTELIREEGVDLVLTMAGTQVLPAVAATCEDLGTPCLSTTFPWHAYYAARGVGPDHAFRWTYHFGWGLDDIAGAFADMWDRLGAGTSVGCLWNDRFQGTTLRNGVFGAVAARRGYRLVDPGGYAEADADFEECAARFLRDGVQIVTSAATTEDLAAFRRQAERKGLRPKLITCSRWLTYPLTPPEPPGLDGIATIVYWSPRHPHRSPLNGMSAADLAALYESRTGRQWLQPLGVAHALFEVAAHVLSTAGSRADVAAAIAATSLDTIAGRLDWTTGPAPNVATIPLTGGRWQPGTRHPHDLVPVTGGDQARP
ncbi:ABC transporter substrate-binding protein [Bailinhaonella thermotolerans]|uniref:ABC transporter substrate-binding protein n=1 Tax=Bailinhaonella thermotolerans TaxID=1070861 RepID=A0A3A4AZB9_9ACTN|nr:ABC transporter substrate-binding protein [Bailinhaonella thermotolerans]RJL35727.1 ABC transporter substrate-binding protein [Bailinhaonella thermotolerans]